MVSHQVHDHNGRAVVCPLRTECSVRTVALDHVTVTGVADVLRQAAAGRCGCRADRLPVRQRSRRPVETIALAHQAAEAIAELVLRAAPLGPARAITMAGPATLRPHTGHIKDQRPPARSA